MAPAADEINPASAPRGEETRRNEKTQDAGSDNGVVAGGNEKTEQMDAAPSALPTEAIRRIWTKGPLVAVFVGLFMMNFSMVFAASSAGVVSTS